MSTFDILDLKSLGDLESYRFKSVYINYKEFLKKNDLEKRLVFQNYIKPKKKQ